MEGIRHIIFDLGGVILNINYQLTSQAFKDLGAANFEELYNQFHANALFENLETGKVSTEDFLSQLQGHLPAGTTAGQITAAWNAMLLNFPLERLQLLQQLRNHYDLFLLSNTNAIHLQVFNQLLEKERGIPSLAVFFDRCYYSHLTGVRKPDAAAYTMVLEENGLKPEHTLFIDDTLPNIEAAKALGIQTIHLQVPKTILDIFRK